MKKFFIIIFLVSVYSMLQAQFRIGTDYSLSVPQKEMGNNINPVHSLHVSFYYTLKGFCNYTAVGVEMGFGNYAYVTKEQDLRFPDGSGINTDVIYTSNVADAALVLRTNLLSKGKAIPYVQVKGGITSFFSNVFVEDPEDGSSCRPLESKNIIRDNAFFAGFGGGLQLDLSSLAQKIKPGNYIIDISINKIKGGDLNYINTKNIRSHIHSDPNTPADPAKGEPLHVQFVNIATQTIHEHQVAELYNSPLRMLDIRIGMLFTLGKN